MRELRENIYCAKICTFTVHGAIHSLHALTYIKCNEKSDIMCNYGYHNYDIPAIKELATSVRILHNKPVAASPGCCDGKDQGLTYTRAISYFGQVKRVCV